MKQDRFRPTEGPAFIIIITGHLCLFSAPDECCRWEVNRKHVHCPAVTLSLVRTGSELISVDVVPALEVKISASSQNT